MCWPLKCPQLALEESARRARSVQLLDTSSARFTVRSRLMTCQKPSQSPTAYNLRVEALIEKSITLSVEEFVRNIVYY